MAADASWLEQLVSSTGIPGAVGTFAIAMYGACAAAEKAARKEALCDISRALRNVGWTGALKPAAITNYVFISTFGRSHLSIRCIVGSVLATIVFWFAGSLVLHYQMGTRVTALFTNFLEDPYPYTWLAFVLLCGFVPDYIALWKTRVLLQRWPHRSSAMYNLALVASDVLLSILIAYVGLTLGAMVEDAVLGSVGTGKGPFWEAFWAGLIETVTSGYVFSIAQDIIRGGPPSRLFEHSEPIWVIFVSSTLFTTIWTTLVLVSSILIKVVTPVQNFTLWFFDVEKKPIQAIGVVSGALVIMGGLAWSVATKIGG